MNLEREFEIMEENACTQLQFSDSVRFGIASDNISLARSYFEKAGFKTEILAESTAPYGVNLGFNAFRHYLILKTFNNSSL